MSPLKVKSIMTLALIAATAAVVVSAQPWPQPPPGDDVCIVDARGSPDPGQLALRPNPCDTEAALLMLDDGAYITILYDSHYAACERDYVYVQYKNPFNGTVTNGYLVSDKYMDCPIQPDPDDSS